MPSKRQITVLRLDNNFRTINAEVTRLVPKRIADYEALYGEIRVPKGAEDD